MRRPYGPKDRQTESELKMEKYVATGNSFLVVDCTAVALDDVEKSSIVLRNVGGRDGVIFVEKRAGLFFMDYFNRDGRRATFCGNGARTFVKFLKDFYNVTGWMEFGTHAGVLRGALDSDGIPLVEMPTPQVRNEISIFDLNGWLVETGVPHVCLLTEGIPKDELLALAPKIRWALDANVNFFSVLGPDHIFVRTYERGVERETLSCGSGVTSCAFVYARVLKGTPDGSEWRVTVDTKGGNLEVSCSVSELVRGIFLKGGVNHG